MAPRKSRCTFLAQLECLLESYGRNLTAVFVTFPLFPDTPKDFSVCTVLRKLRWDGEFGVDPSLRPA